ncbi:14340_t:CDS:2, partial [Gigaspora rosea]
GSFDKHSDFYFVVNVYKVNLRQSIDTGHSIQSPSVCFSLVLGTETRWEVRVWVFVKVM